jgi:hypothetical protein
MLCVVHRGPEALCCHNKGLCGCRAAFGVFRQARPSQRPSAPSKIRQPWAPDKDAGVASIARAHERVCCVENSVVRRRDSRAISAGLDRRSVRAEQLPGRTLSAQTSPVVYFWAAHRPVSGVIGQTYALCSHSVARLSAPATSERRPSPVLFNYSDSAAAHLPHNDTPGARPSLPPPARRTCPRRPRGRLRSCLFLLAHRIATPDRPTTLSTTLSTRPPTPLLLRPRTLGALRPQSLPTALAENLVFSKVHHTGLFCCWSSVRPPLLPQPLFLPLDGLSCTRSNLLLNRNFVARRTCCCALYFSSLSSLRAYLGASAPCLVHPSRLPPLLPCSFRSRHADSATRRPS